MSGYLATDSWSPIHVQAPVLALTDLWVTGAPDDDNWIRWSPSGKLTTLAFNRQHVQKVAEQQEDGSRRSKQK